MGNLRRYPHPGKFEGGLVIDEVAYQASLHMADDEVSDEFSGASLIRGPIEGTGDFPDLNSRERAYLASIAGCIIDEDGQGFVRVEYFDDSELLESAWSAILEAFSGDESV